MILAEDLERLVVRRASLVNEIVDALLPDYQFFPLLKARLGLCLTRRILFEYVVDSLTPGQTCLAVPNPSLSQRHLVRFALVCAA